MIHLDVDGEVAIATLDRPPVNAIDEAMIDAMMDMLDDVEQRDAGALLFRSAHSRFCAGADITMIRGFLDSDGGVDQMIGFTDRLQQVYARIESFPLVTVAAIDGVATGGGLELALACDLRVAGEDVRVGLPEVNIGLLPGAGGTQRLTRIAGRGTALRTILTAELHTGAEAVELGIVQWAVPTEQVQPFALDLARGVADRPRRALAEVKGCIALAPSDEGYRAELEGSRRLLEDPATRTTVNAFFCRNSASKT